MTTYTVVSELERHLHECVRADFALLDGAFAKNVEVDVLLVQVYDTHEKRDNFMFTPYFKPATSAFARVTDSSISSAACFSRMH